MALLVGTRGGRVVVIAGRRSPAATAVVGDGDPARGRLGLEGWGVGLAGSWMVGDRGGTVAGGAKDGGAGGEGLDFGAGKHAEDSNEVGTTGHIS